MDRTVKTSTRVIEHIVLLKSKERAPTEQQDAMVSGLRSLKSLPMVIELNAGKVAHASSEGYTHALHCRYRSKDDLASYANDPYHLDVINKCIVPIVEDRLALDWEADVEEPVLQSGSYGAVRILTMKPKQELANSEIEGTIDALKEYTSKFSFVKQVSAGKNFSPARAKGYEWAYLAMFPSTKELAELINSDGYKGLHSKVSSIMEKFNIVDYHTA
ncbi:hypothetical protein KP509_24G007900 [Ceratopteris richardii]|nr:hypothetical protein KP509_24G007900 [Ceratopteris richardii]